MIMQRQVLVSCNVSVIDVGVVPQLQFLDRLFFLIVTETGTHSCGFSAGCGVFQYIDKVVDVLGKRLLYGGLWMNFTCFSCCSRCLLGIWTSFPRAPCSGSHLPLCVATVHGGFWTNFFFFLHEKWTPSSPRSSHPGNLNINSTSSIWQSPRASVYVASEEFHIFSS